MSRMGQPIKLNEMVVIDEPVKGGHGETMKVTKKLGEAFVDLLEVGHDPDDVCDVLDVSLSSFYNWQRLGRDAAAKLAEGYDDKLTENDYDYMDFLHRSQRARGSLKRRLEARLADLVPTMEPREVTDVLARLDKVKWSKASSMKLDVNGEINVVEHHGAAVGRLVRMVVDGLIEVAPKAARAKLAEAAPGIVQAALAEVVAPADRSLSR